MAENQYMKVMARIFSVLGAFLFLGVQAALAAGSGTLQGKVFDRESKDALPGATVLVKGTSMGASTDLNGGFTIHGIPAGEQTIVVSYVGYNSSTAKVDIPAGGTVTKNFYLKSTAVQGKVVVVTAQAQGQMQAINQQLSSDKIVNVVSAAKIQSLPDFNAASAIGRLPGVSVVRSDGEATKVVINGIAPQYNEVAIGNIPLASTGNTQIGISSENGIPQSNLNQNRSVNLAMITPYMIKSIQVYKTLTPDMDADAIGGYVNMELQSAPRGFHSDLLWQSGYTSKSNGYGNYRAVASASNRFFDNKLGAFLLLDAESYNRNADNMSAGYSIVSDVPGSNGYLPVQVQSVTLDRHIETRKRYGANLILDYKLPHGVIRSVNMYSRLNSNYQDYQTGLGYNTKDLGFSYSSSDKTTDLALNTLEFKDDFGFMSMDLGAANTYSRNYIPSEPIYTFSMTGGLIGNAPTNTIPQDLTSLQAFSQNGGASQLLMTSMGLYSTYYKENDQQYKTDFKIPLSVGPSVSGYFKFGGMYRYMYHTNSQTTPYATPTYGLQPNINMMDSIQSNFGIQYNKQLEGFSGNLFTTTDSKLLGSFLNNQFGQIYWVPNDGLLNSIVNYVATTPSLLGTAQGGWQDGPFQHLANSYKYIEKYYAGYAMANLDIGPNLMIVGGARYEEDRSLYFAYNMHDTRDPNHQPVYPITVYPQNHYWLPMVQGRYKVNSWSDIRYSYYQSLARPAYTELAPNYTINQYGGSVFAGNPNLKPAKSYNQNVEIDFHSNSLGLLSISGFYKTIAHFTYATNYQLFTHIPAGLGLDSVGSFVNPPATAGQILYTFINSPYNAYVGGVTVDYQTHFWYLPAPFNGLVFGINYSHMTSSATYPFMGTKNIPNPANPRRAITTILDSTRTGRLVDQPNDLMNAYVGYDYRGFSARLSFLLQGNSVSYVGNYKEQDGFTKNYFRIDAQVRQILPWRGFQLFLNAENINNEANISTQSSIGGFTSEEYYGMTVDLGIRYIL